MMAMTLSHRTSGAKMSEATGNIGRLKRRKP
jgi:hypothetical protein